MDKAVVFLGSGFELIMVCLGGTYLGNYIDQKMGWANYATAGVVIVLMIGWFIHLIYLLRRFDKSNEKPESKP